MDVGALVDDLEDGVGLREGVVGIGLGVPGALTMDEGAVVCLQVVASGGSVGWGRNEREDLSGIVHVLADHFHGSARGGHQVAGAVDDVVLRAYLEGSVGAGLVGGDGSFQCLGSRVDLLLSGGAGENGFSGGDSSLQGGTHVGGVLSACRAFLGVLELVFAIGNSGLEGCRCQLV